jgi:D-lyxose ketol-isomerase
MREASQFCQRQNFHLPPWAFYSPRQWADILADLQRAVAHVEIVENALGWDLTDFGSGDYARTGLLLFTIRNGKPGVRGGKSYCEKLLIVKEGQHTPYHFHWSKMEDIIVRGGGNLQMKLYVAAKKTRPGSKPPPVDERSEVRVSIDGVVRVFKPGETVTLHPGESVCYPPYLYHEFWGEPGKGTVLVGEVSTVNDDARDNCFLNAPGRFPAIEEDAQPLYLLCTEYLKAERYG